MANVRTDKRIIKTKKAVRTALIELMSKKDLVDITVSELAKKANINRKTFYSHYPNVQAVFEDIEDEMIYDLKTLITQQKAENYSLPSNALLTFCKQMNSDFSFYHRLSMLNSSTLIEKHKCLLIDMILRESLKNIKCSEEKKVLIMEFVAGGLLSMSTKWFKSDMNLSFEEMLQIASDITSNINSEWLTNLS